MTNKKIPEPGPARDRMVAYLLGWRPFAEQRGEYTHVVWVAPGKKPGEGVRDPKPSTELTPEQINPKRHIEHCLARYSTSPADALAALEAWVAKKSGREWRIDFHSHIYGVTLYEAWPLDCGNSEESTLPAAATAALLATREGT